MISHYPHPLCRHPQHPNAKSFFPQRAFRNPSSQCGHTVYAIPFRQFIQIQPERMIFCYAGGINTPRQITIPTPNTGLMRFQTDSIQHTLIDRLKSLVHPFQQTKFSFFRQNIITKIIMRFQEKVYTFSQLFRFRKQIPLFYLLSLFKLFITTNRRL